MPGTGHSHRYKGSISNRNTKSSFQVLAPWNSVKNGEKNQVAVSTGGNKLNFELMGAKMMSNYNDASNAWILDCSLVVLGNKIVDGSAIIQGNVIIDGTLDVSGLATFEDVDICGNLNVAGESIFYGKLTNLDNVDGSGNGGIITKYLTVQEEAYINLGSINHLVDVCDNVLTLGNHVAFPATKREVRGIAAKYWNGADISNVAFFGMDPSFNGGLIHDLHGQFVFLIDVSNNVGTITASDISGTLGRACFGTLDINGSSLYGDGGSLDGHQAGAPTQNVSGQANCQMHLVGKTIITQDGGISAKLDISGGLNVDGDICGNGMNFAINYANVDISGSNTVDISGGTTNIDAGGTLSIGPVGTSIVIGNSNATVDISGSRVDISGGASSCSLSSVGVNIESVGNANFTTTAGDIQITGAGGVNIAAAAAAGINIGGGATTVDISGATSVDISGGTTTLDATTALNIGPISQNIAIGNSSANVDISGLIVDISGGTQVKLIDGSGANINIASGRILLDVSSSVLNPFLGQIKLSDGSGAYIDMSGGKIDISGDEMMLLSLVHLVLV